MRHSHGHGDGDLSRGRRGSAHAIQVICLGSGGGPSESNVSGFLVRSGAKHWSKGSVLAVDAGVHLSSIIRLLEPSFPLVAGPHNTHTADEPINHSNGGGDHAEDTPVATQVTPFDSSDSEFSDVSTPEPTIRLLESGPFKDLPFPFETARANALHVVRECVSTYLITHPHLDHISGFVINTAGFHNTTRPKKLAALPSTVNAIKRHIFNDVIWPNLTDEDGGVGFVTFQRLASGGNVAVGEGHGRGYIEVCDGLCVKGMKVSHGHCSRGSDIGIHRGSDVGLSEIPGSKRGSIVNIGSPTPHRRSVSHLVQQQHAPGTPQPNAGAPYGHGSHHEQASSRGIVVDSTAYFIRDDATGREVLIFGDVEPDAISLNPRNAVIWHEAAPKIVHGSLRAIFIECSYDDSQGDAILFGHLAPRHLFAELASLADKVRQRRVERSERRKRKHESLHHSHPHPHPHGHGHGHHLHGHGHRNSIAHFPPTFGNYAMSKTTPSTADVPHADPLSPADAHRPAKRSRLQDLSDSIAPHEQDSSPPTPGGFATPDALSQTGSPAGTRRVSWGAPPRTVTGETDGSTGDLGHAEASEPPLAGITVMVTHVKDTFRDWPLAGDTILQQLRANEAELRETDGMGLGCEFVVCDVGGSYWF